MIFVHPSFHTFKGFENIPTKQYPRFQGTQQDSSSDNTSEKEADPDKAEEAIVVQGQPVYHFDTILVTDMNNRIKYIPDISKKRKNLHPSSKGSDTPRIRIHVIDTFEQGTVYPVTNSQAIYALHGQLTKSVLQMPSTNKPPISFNVSKSYKTIPTPDCPYKTQEIETSQALTGVINKVNKSLKQKQRVKEFLNLSRSYPIYFNQLKKIFHLPVNPDNIKKRRENLIAALKKSNEKEFKEIVKIINALEKLVKLGVTVFVSAGNKGPQSLNLFLLADGVKGVGALNEDGSKASYSGDNTLVSEWEVADHTFSPVIQQDNQLTGFSIYGDNIVDLPLKDCYFSEEFPEGIPLKELNRTTHNGTSASAPKALLRAVTQIALKN